MRVSAIIPAIVAGLALQSAASAGTCLPDYMALDTFQRVDTPSFSHRLKSENASGVFLTEATLDGEWGDTTLALTFRFAAEGVGIPYTIYALLVTTDNDVLLFDDLTGGCAGPGVSIFRGQEFALTPIKLPAPARAPLHIFVWGR